MDLSTVPIKKRPTFLLLLFNLNFCRFGTLKIHEAREKKGGECVYITGCENKSVADVTQLS